jgi:hypothetical protein
VTSVGGSGNSEPGQPETARRQLKSLRTLRIAPVFTKIQIFSDLPKELPAAAGQPAVTVNVHRDWLKWGELQ